MEILMPETFLTAIKAAVMAAIMQTFGLYAGAGLIALVAACARLAYTAEQASFRLFGRFFAMSLALTMFIVHLGRWQNWDTEEVVMVSGASAFMCRELLEVLMTSKSAVIKQIIKRLI